MTRLVVLLVVTGICYGAVAQTGVPDFNFVNYQRSFPVFNEALKRKGMSKARAAKIANSGKAGSKKGGRNSHKGTKH